MAPHERDAEALFHRWTAAIPARHTRLTLAAARWWPRDKNFHSSNFHQLFILLAQGPSAARCFLRAALLGAGMAPELNRYGSCISIANVKAADAAATSRAPMCRIGFPRVADACGIGSKSYPH